ncbi:MAG: hypothetical protein JWN18_45 [Parcubacteria group bacterium]|nr:hypothetical protein [Parcubacteria group bacterium]
MEDMVQYKGDLADKYSSQDRLAHPQNMVPYSTWLEELGDIQSLEILDLACGSGYGSRMLAERGARVTGVDIAPEMIAKAQEIEALDALGITYIVSDAKKLDLHKTFDIVAPSFLFNYAKDKQELIELIATAAIHLNTGGRMVALNAPPNPIILRLPNANSSTEWLGEPNKEGSLVRMHFYDLKGDWLCDIDFNYWSKETYEECFNLAGFTNIEWVPMRMTEEGKRLLPNWQDIEKNICSIVVKGIKA